MPSASYMKRLTTALAAAALASSMAVSGAHAHHGSQSPGEQEVPPPASSIAASAGEQYQDLRSPDAADAARVADKPSEVAPPASSIAASAGEDYQALRSAGAGDLASARPAPAQQPVADEPSGFDPVSAVIGAIAAAALSLVLMATLSTRRPTGRRAASA